MPNAIPNTTPIGHSTRGSPSHHHRESDAGPYRDEDVLLSLQLLAYLSKYPHVRQAFYKPRVSFHPASAHLPGRNYPGGVQESESSRNGAKAPAASMKDTFLRTFGRGKEKERASPSSTYGSFTTGASGSSSSPNGASSSSASYKTYPAAPATTPPLVRQTNVFSLVERFTFRPSASENDLFNAPPKLPPEIQYWAGVIMRNACRKDESRGGIRQCANMLCGRWESYPREFAKCRRCRKAKYCGKDCQSTAWSEGHRFWCSAKDGDDEGLHSHESSSRNAAAANSAPEADAEVELPAASGDDPVAARPHNGTHNLTTGGTIRAGTRQRVMALVEPRTRPVVPNTNDRAEEGLAFAGLHVGTSRFVPPINTATADATGALLHTMFSASLPTSPTTIGPTPTASRTRRPAEDTQVALGFRYHAGDTSTSTTADHRDVREGRRHPPQREQLSATEYDSRQLADVLALYSNSGRSNPSPRSTLRARPEHLRAQIMDQQAAGSPSESYTHPASGSTTSSPIPPPRRRHSGHPTADPLMIPHYSTETSTAESSPTARSQRTPMEDTRRRRHQVDSSDQDMVIG
ncbi:hypothetical protein ONZ45_g17151 [Pleurotus djamor]|nr:hypothetical protein ONZ45_g17151 [Pleurotus djamor]